MKTLEEQQARAWSLAPEDAKCIVQGDDGSFHANRYDSQPVASGSYWESNAAGWVELYQGEINGWDWRDTLQSREEFEAMTSEKLNQQELADKWVPEVGQECEFRTRPRIPALENYADQFEPCRPDLLSKDGAVVTDRNGDQCFMGYLDYHVEFRSIPTEADNRREQEGLLDKLCFEAPTKTSAGYWLYKQGVRVLQPNQFVANELTDEQIIDLLTKHKLKPLSEFYNAVIAEMKKVQP